MVYCSVYSIVSDRANVETPVRYDISILGFKFRFISYNILAQVYVKSSYFQHSPSSCLKWKARSQAILMNFKNFDADFLCIQELDEYGTFYKSNMENLGYLSLYIKRSGQKRDGCGIFYKPRSAKLLQTEEIDYNDLVNCASALNEIGNNKVLDLETRDAPIEELSRKHQSDDPHVRLKRDCVGLLAAFQLNDSSNHIIVVANTHIYWDPNWADIKLAQVKYLLSRLSQFKELVSNKFTCIPSVLVAGDFNSTPGDEILTTTDADSPKFFWKWRPQGTMIIGFFGRGYRGDEGEEQAADTTEVRSVHSKGEGSMDVDTGAGIDSKWRGAESSESDVYRYLVSASEVAPIQLRSLYAAHGGEPTFTNCTPDFTGTLDYIFLSGSHLRAVSLLEVPGPESADVIGGLPNHHHPSDHLPIGADFSVVQSP
ncbi:hypothetical protein C4D60_Mb08t15240 [Musa balbisiana]|uniref:Endonuclease/exonuclease/phosphatase domain-containing protein n=1 Tax=Musa balbisiana TaxID=52838 RepID=A0A4S8K425_MUSBA|nr:hypothetical protein C4D60_Mb08t15240 [Musa balbisiana]